jgi:hypothetical protein
MTSLLSTLSAYILGKQGSKARRERNRDLYRKTHDEMAAKVGIVIPWAKP